MLDNMAVSFNPNLNLKKERINGSDYKLSKKWIQHRIGHYVEIYDNLFEAAFADTVDGTNIGKGPTWPIHIEQEATRNVLHVQTEGQIFPWWDFKIEQAII